MSELTSNQIATIAADLRTVSDATYPLRAAIAPEYDATATYSAGDYCVRNGLMYKCNTTITSGGEVWNIEHWDEVNVGDSLNEIRNSVIHIGPDAPTNEHVQVWLDTDEQGASVVSSVNDATGTVVLNAEDVGAMSEWVLLWENASPTSAFAAQTVSLDLSDYDAIMLEYQDYGSGKCSPIATLFVGMAYRIHMTISHMMERDVTINSNGVVFGDNIYAESYPQAPFKTNNGYIIPHTIWGIQHIKGATT